MKQLILTAFVFIAFTGAAFAQNTDNANINVGVNIVPALSITNSQDLAFGNVALGATTGPTLSAVDGSTTATTGTTTVGRFTVTGAPGELVNITNSGATTLNGPSSSTVSFTPTIAQSSSETTGYATGSSFTFTGTQGGTSAATHYIQVGGSLDVSGASASGSHTGTFTVTVTYASL